MLLKQKFKTLEGVQKRVAFENNHRHVLYGNENKIYSIVWFLDGKVARAGEIPKEAFSTNRIHWQMMKTRAKSSSSRLGAQNLLK